MDADTICHSPINEKELRSLVSGTLGNLLYLGRKGKYSECGLYAMNLGDVNLQLFLKEFQRVYDEAENGIFQMEEWHDSYVFDKVRVRFPQLRQYSWSGRLNDLRPRPGMSAGEGHPLINCEWGAYLDHLKGGRKQTGKSHRQDLKIRRTEAYWNQR